MSKVIAKPNLAEVLSQTKSFIESELHPLEPIFLQEGFGAVLPALREKREQVKKLGLFYTSNACRSGWFRAQLARLWVVERNFR